MAATRRTDRIELRTTKEEKELLVQAAAYQGLDATSFIRATVLPRAREVIAQTERVSLSARAATQVLDLLDDPPEPTDALLAAARRHHRAG